MSDLIERQGAIDALWKLDVELKPSAIDAVLDMLKSLPPAQPERKMGHWEDVPHKSVEHGEVVVDGETVRCSVCRHAEKGWNKDMNYCPECGAKMEVKNDSGSVPY